MSVWTDNFDFLDQICPKGIFPVQNKKSEHHQWTFHIQISLATKFQLKLTILFFWTKFWPKNCIFDLKWKSEHHHWILHIWISLGIKFQLKLTILIFWTKFAQKGYFWEKTEKVNITIEFCMFELVLVPNLTLNKQFWFFGPNLPEKDISGRKRKNWASPLNSAYLN